MLIKCKLLLPWHAHGASFMAIVGRRALAKWGVNYFETVVIEDFETVVNTLRQL